MVPSSLTVVHVAAADSRLRRRAARRVGDEAIGRREHESAEARRPRPLRSAWPSPNTIEPSTARIISASGKNERQQHLEDLEPLPVPEPVKNGERGDAHAENDPEPQAGTGRRSPAPAVAAGGCCFDRLRLRAGRFLRARLGRRLRPGGGASASGASAVAFFGARIRLPRVPPRRSGPSTPPFLRRRRHERRRPRSARPCWPRPPARSPAGRRRPAPRRRTAPATA